MILMETIPMTKEEMMEKKLAQMDIELKEIKMWIRGISMMCETICNKFELDIKERYGRGRALWPTR